MNAFTDERATDEEIVALALRKKEAFAVLVRRYEARLARYVRRLGVFRTEDVEDLLQNVFLNAYRNLNAFDQALRFSSWIYRIAHNETMSFFRSRSVRPEGSLVPDGEELLVEIPDLVDIQGETDKRLSGELLGKALYQLDAKYREVLILRYFEEREYSEISDILQIPVSSVGTLLSRAKKKLRTHYPTPPTV
ncbi:RNA polymerase sigma factor [Candidatus Uhrbacteria bacterium]|nr:RNA polymerase sigma factor [Candidatus Uhrbacteria bacterium]